MSEHKATLTWTRGDRDFTYKTYPRDHEWAFENGQTLKASAAPDYLGSVDCVDPEEAYTAALASCHMLTFLAISAMSGFTVDAYTDHAVGHLAKNERGKPWLAKVAMHPQITFSGDKQPNADQLQSLHEKAHHECFLANSVNTEITWG
jgi:organic hydroperoxide reductase OsmC/OhrA